MPLRIACTLLSDLFVKKETVTGIIGNTQGVSNAISPPKKPRRKIVHKLVSSVFAAPQSLTGWSTSIVAIFSLLEFDEAVIPPSNFTENENSEVLNSFFLPRKA